VPEEPHLAIDAAREARERTVRMDDAVTRHDDREGVARDRGADRACRTGSPERVGDRPVAARPAGSDPAQRTPDGALTIAAARIERDREAMRRIGEVRAQLAHRTPEHGTLSRTPDAVPGRRSMALEVHADERIARCDERELAER
jgi:hypothetical protein